MNDYLHNLAKPWPSLVSFWKGLIKSSAYLKWEAAGYPEGQDLTFWLEAETEFMPQADEWISLIELAERRKQLHENYLHPNVVFRNKFEQTV